MLVPRLCWVSSFISRFHLPARRPHVALQQCNAVKTFYHLALSLPATSSIFRPVLVLFYSNPAQLSPPERKSVSFLNFAFSPQLRVLNQPDFCQLFLFFLSNCL